MATARISLELFKAHVRADDFTGDDEYLTHLLATAEEAVLTHLNRPDLREAEVLPLPVVHAVLLLGGHWYNQRESVSAVQMHSVPDTLQSLLKPFRRLGGDPKEEATCRQEG